MYYLWLLHLPGHLLDSGETLSLAVIELNPVHTNEVPEPRPTQNVSRDTLTLGDLELLILPPLSPERWDDKCASLCQVYAVLRLVNYTPMLYRHTPASEYLRPRLTESSIPAGC